MDRKSQSRRDFLKTLSYGAVALSLPACNAPAVPPRKTNIVYVLADDLGYGDLSCYGQ